MGRPDFLELVLSAELAVRDDRRFRQVRLSRLPHRTTLGESGFASQSDLDPCKVEDSRPKRNLR
nr:ATP-binding protein [Streptomyces antibioticus]